MKEKFFRYFLTLLCLLGITLLLGSFLKDTAKYAYLSWRIDDTEQAAQEGYYTENGRVTWWDAITNQYEREVADKNAFIESNDVANFLHHCAYSCTGNIIRVLAILVALVGFGVTVYLLVITSQSFISYLRRYCKYLYLKKKRARNRRHNRTR